MKLTQANLGRKGLPWPWEDATMEKRGGGQRLAPLRHLYVWAPSRDQIPRIPVHRWPRRSSPLSLRSRSSAFWLTRLDSPDSSHLIYQYTVHLSQVAPGIGTHFFFIFILIYVFVFLKYLHFAFNLVIFFFKYVTFYLELSSILTDLTW